MKSNRELQKAESRRRDVEDLSTGRKTVEQLREENSLVRPAGSSIQFKNWRPGLDKVSSDVDTKNMPKTEQLDQLKKLPDEELLELYFLRSNLLIEYTRIYLENKNKQDARLELDTVKEELEECRQEILRRMRK